MVEQLSAQGICPCTACGALLKSPARSPVLACPNCGTEQYTRPARRVVDRDWAPLAAVRPEELVVPFGIDEAGARRALREWVRSRRFAPRWFGRLDRAEALTSVYLPHWRWEAETRSRYVGDRGRHHWSVDGRGNRFRHTSWEPVRAAVACSFGEVVVPATRRVPGRLLWGLAGGSAAGSEPSRTELLAGHRVLEFDVDPEVGLSEAKLKMDELVRSEVRRDIGGDAQRVRAVDTEYAGLGYTLLLLPVWSVVYETGSVAKRRRVRGGPRQVLVDGRTGAVSGVRPWSAWKLALAVGLPLIVTSVALVMFVMTV